MVLNMGLMFSIFSEPQSATEFPSKLPISWRVSHILLCLTGVNNVYFIKLLPTSLRVASLIYHAAWLCLSAPLFVLYIYCNTWDGSVTNILQQVGMTISYSYILILGATFMFNALKRNRTTKFLRNWYLLDSNNTVRYGNGKAKCYRNVRAALVISTISQPFLYVALTVRSFLITDLHTVGSLFFGSLNASPEALTALYVIYTVLFLISAFNATLTTCHFALVTITLAEEFDKLYRGICNLLSSSCFDVNVWEQVRFRYKALVSLVNLHSRLSTMMLGPILITCVMSLCFNFYYVLAVGVEVLAISSIITAIAILWAIISPSNILENKVSHMFISNVANSS